MRKKLFIIFIVLIIIISVGIIYLNNVILPTKIKSFIVKSLKEQTQKKVNLESVQFSIFKGLILRNLIIYDNEKTILSLKEGSCTLLILPIFKKIIAIPNLRLRSPEVLLERRADNTFNLQDLIPKKALTAKPSKFSIFIYKISVNEGIIHFKDDTFAQPLTKDFKHLNVSINLSLPASVKFNLKSQISANPIIKISASGEYAIPEQELKAIISIQDFSPAEFRAYYQNSGIIISEGLIDATFNLKLKDNNLHADISAKNRNTVFSKDRYTVRISSDLTSTLQYSLKDKQINQLNGNIKVFDATLKLLNTPIENINGVIEFNQNQLKWSDFNFKYLQVPYKTEGTLANFQLPKVELRLSSEDLSLNSDLTINNKLIKLTKLSAKFLNSDLSFKGDINTANAPSLEADISGELNIDLKDIKHALKNLNKRLEEINPQGLINTKLALKGNINDFKSCNVQARLSSDNLSAYGLKAKVFSLTYNQADGIADITPVHLSLYDGTVEAEASVNLSSTDIPYWVSAEAKGIKLEKLKLDTPVKDKDITGTLQTQIKLNGFSNDISKLSGSGNILISEGKLWQLNLFQGLGSLLFAKDFANIVFREGSCGFVVRDKYVFTDNLKLKSDITDLSGRVKIGFDSSIDASVDVEVIDEMVPLSGTLKDITTAIIGEGGKFAVIKITGTLKEPKYKFKPAVSNIIKGLRDTFFGK